MFKKLVATSAILAASSGIAFAQASPYLGASLGVKSDNSTRELVGTVAGGYGATLGAAQNFYLGGEIFADLGSASLSNNMHARTTYGFGASVLPGIVLNKNTIGYLRAGFITSRFNNVNVSSTGAQLGAGLQTNLVQHWDLRGEYVYTAYHHVSNMVGSPKADQFNLGVVYKLD